MPARTLAALPVLLFTVAALTACGETFVDDGAGAGAEGGAAIVDGATSSVPDSSTSAADAGNGDGDEGTDATTPTTADDGGPTTNPSDASASTDAAPAIDSGPAPDCTQCGAACCDDATQICGPTGCTTKPAAATTGNTCYTFLGTSACIAGDVCAPTTKGEGVCSKTCTSSTDCAVTNETCAEYEGMFSICTCNQQDVCDQGQTCSSRTGKCS